MAIGMKIMPKLAIFMSMGLISFCGAEKEMVNILSLNAKANLKRRVLTRLTKKSGSRLWGSYYKELPSKDIPYQEKMGKQLLVLIGHTSMDWGYIGLLRVLRLGEYLEKWQKYYRSIFFLSMTTVL